MNAWELPTSLEVNGKSYEIRSDFRAILDIIRALNDPENDDFIKQIILLKIMYVEFDSIPEQDMKEAFEKAVEFIDAGDHSDKKDAPKLMDWEKDANILIPSINKAAGQEVRALPYLHWWTFIGYYMEIGDGTFAQVVNIRNKKHRGKKLETWEREFYKHNKDIVDMAVKVERPQEEKDALRKLLGL